MWNIRSRSRFNPDLTGFTFVSRIPPYNSNDYNNALATYHMAPSEEIEIDDQSYAVPKGTEYPKWGLCRGFGNAAFLDLHVQSLPFTADAYDYSWPLLKNTDEEVRKIIK